MARNVKAPLAACLACAVALGLLAVAALGVERGRHVDSRLFFRLAEDPRSDAGGLAETLATLGDLLPVLAMLAIACGIALVRRRPGSALAAVLVVAGANVTTQLLKVLLAHPRVKVAIGGDPFEANTFPSGHTTAVASLAVAYLFVVPAAWRKLTLTIGAVTVLAVGYSVVAIAWHYPSDVLGGILVAAGWGFAVLALGRAVTRRSPRGVRVSRPAPLPSP